MAGAVGAWFIYILTGTTRMQIVQFSSHYHYFAELNAQQFISHTALCVKNAINSLVVVANIKTKYITKTKHNINNEP